MRTNILAWGALVSIASLTCACGKAAPATKPVPATSVNWTASAEDPWKLIAHGEKSRTYAQPSRLAPGDPIVVVSRSTKVFQDERLRRASPEVFIREMGLWQITSAPMTMATDRWKYRGV